MSAFWFIFNDGRMRRVEFDHDTPGATGALGDDIFVLHRTNFVAMFQDAKIPVMDFCPKQAFREMIFTRRLEFRAEYVGGPWHGQPTKRARLMFREFPWRPQSKLAQAINAAREAAHA